MREIQIWTDGSGGVMMPQGLGGWAAIFKYNDGKEFYLNGFETKTTNNRMEMMGFIAALEYISRYEDSTQCKVTLHSDSEYVVKGSTEWLPGWKATDWKKGKLKNKDLWEYIDVLLAKVKVDIKWVRGHNHNEGNELADTAAKAAYANLLPVKE